MTSRERVLAAMERRRPDRAPIDLCHDSSSLTGMAWVKLMDHLGLDKGPGPRVIDPYQQIVLLNDALRDRFEIDTIGLWIEPAAWRADTLPDGAACLSPDKWRPVTQPNGDRVVFDAAGRPAAWMPGGSFYFDSVNPPLAGDLAPGDLDRFAAAIAATDLPGYADEPIEATAARAARLHRETDKAILVNFCWHLLHAGTGLRGYEQFMIDLATDRPLVERLLDLVLEVYTLRMERWGKLFRGHVDVVMFNDDLGTQAGPIISPRTYRELIWPREEQLFARAKQAFGAKILFHSCGAVSEFIPDFIAAGADALNPVQVSADGMDSAGLKRRFGREICFWGGGCDSQKVLCGGTVRQVREEVRRRIGDLAPGGGFVFAQVHNIQPDVPPENIVALLEAAREFGG